MELSTARLSKAGRRRREKRAITASANSSEQRAIVDAESLNDENAKARPKQDTSNSPPTKPPAKKRSAARAVGGIYELVEQIALELPPKQLFPLQRVNSQWQGVIQQSERLQRQMGLLSVISGKRGDSHAAAYAKKMGILIPLRYIQESGPRTYNRLSCAGVRISPDFSCYRADRFWPHPGPLMSAEVHLRFKADASDPSSWQQLPLTEPATTQIMLKVKVSIWKNRGSHWRAVEKREGFTLGDVYNAHNDFIKELAENYGVCVTSEHIEGSCRMALAVTAFCKVHDKPSCSQLSRTWYNDDDGGCTCFSWV